MHDAVVVVDARRAFEQQARHAEPAIARARGQLGADVGLTGSSENAKAGLVTSEKEPLDALEAERSGGNDGHGRKDSLPVVVKSL